MNRRYRRTVALALVALACSTTKASRINPPSSTEPPRYRITCEHYQHRCRSKAEELCRADYGGEYTVLRHDIGVREPARVGGSGVSSTAPWYGDPDATGELLIECGRRPPPLRLVRRRPKRPEPSAAATRCVPGSTQRCLGPGACPGAQACLPTGAGYSPCDCDAPAAYPTEPPSRDAGIPAPDAGTDPG